MPRNSRIRILPEEAVNKVAAGEVVERPAAVVKELFENALDAGAGQIEIHLAGAGKRLIRVRDDGSGMTHDEALLSLERHSTSKISDASDLANIATLGFRGEALPSLAAVSKMQLTTRARGEEEGTRVRIEGGKITQVSPWGSPEGTEVEVRRLFYNVPARVKFLKSSATELSHCLQVATRLALAHPALDFTLTHDTRTVLRLAPENDIGSRLRDHLGTDFFGNFHAPARAAPVRNTGSFSSTPAQFKTPCSSGA
jgi:DNA mismatch repair protein MutL